MVYFGSVRQSYDGLVDPEVARAGSRYHRKVTRVDAGTSRKAHDCGQRV